MTNIHEQPVIVYELGNFQVFCYQTLEDWTTQVQPKEYYWKKKGEYIANGPFKTIYDATNHFSSNLTLVHDKTKLSYKDNLIQVDFKAKKRIK